VAQVVAAPRNGVLAPLPQNIDGIAASSKKTALKTESDDLIKMFTKKMIQQQEVRDEEWECNEQ
jgi:hypothetical protein